MEIIIIIDDGKEYKKIIPKLKKGIAIKLIKTNGSLKIFNEMRGEEITSNLYFS